MPDPARYFLIAAVLGGASEIIARALRLWIYRNAALPVLNVLLMFGMVQGVSVAWLIGGHQPLIGVAPVLFMTGALIGVVYEGLNEFRLRAWSWPDASLLGLTRSIDKAAAVGAAWGLVPVVTAAIARLPVFSAGHA